MTQMTQREAGNSWSMNLTALSNVLNASTFEPTDGPDRRTRLSVPSAAVAVTAIRTFATNASQTASVLFGPALEASGFLEPPMDAPLAPLANMDESSGWFDWIHTRDDAAPEEEWARDANPQSDTSSDEEEEWRSATHESQRSSQTRSAKTIKKSLQIRKKKARACVQQGCECLRLHGVPSVHAWLPCV